MASFKFQISILVYQFFDLSERSKLKELLSQDLQIGDVIDTLENVLKLGRTRPLFNLFSSFQTNITIFPTNICEKFPSSTQCR